MKEERRMKWREYAGEIKEVLGLRGSPVAVTYSMGPPSKASSGKCRVCDAFLQARDGKVIDLTAKSSACPGGTWHLGLGERPKGEGDKAFKDFLVKGEKLYCSVAALYRMQYLSSTPPLGLAEHVILWPMEKAEFEPDLVLFICNAVQACRLVTLDSYDAGIPPKIEMAGSTCHQAVGYPVVTGEPNVSLMDYTSRKIQGYKADELIVSVPYHRFHGVMRSVDGCTAGRAKMEIPQSFRRFIDAGSARGVEV
jgi:uncharacterized protein (DUF169 family)